MHFSQSLLDRKPKTIWRLSVGYSLPVQTNNPTICSIVNFGMASSKKDIPQVLKHFDKKCHKEFI